MTKEFARFISIWEKSIYRFDKILSQVTDAAYRDIPVPSDANFLGKRVGEIMIDTLVRHLVVAERHWLRTLVTIEDGQAIPKPESIVANADLDAASAGKFYKAEITAATEVLKTISPDQLEKHVKWDNNTFTIMGFLWNILSHHTYHLGQIDLIMRQNNILPLDIFNPEALGNNTSGNSELVG